MIYTDKTGKETLPKSAKIKENDFFGGRVPMIQDGKEEIFLSEYINNLNKKEWDKIKYSIDVNDLGQRDLLGFLLSLEGLMKNPLIKVGDEEVMLDVSKDYRILIYLYERLNKKFSNRAKHKEAKPSKTSIEEFDPYEAQFGIKQHNPRKGDLRKPAAKPLKDSDSLKIEDLFEEVE